MKNSSIFMKLIVFTSLLVRFGHAMENNTEKQNVLNFCTQLKLINPRAEINSFIIWNDYPENKIIDLYNAYHIEIIPAEIGDLQSVEILSFNNNEAIKELPEEIGKLTQLKQLYLLGLQLTAFPEAIKKLTNLEVLDLTGNQISSVPNWIGSLTKLRELELQSNKIKFIHPKMENLTNLEVLALANNPYLGKKLSDNFFQYSKMVPIFRSFCEERKPAIIILMLLKANNLCTLSQDVLGVIIRFFWIDQFGRLELEAHEQ